MTSKAADTSSYDDSNPAIAAFSKKLLNPVLQRLFLLAKLPSAFFMGIRIQAMAKEEASVTVPFRWSSQNPFKSTYFAAQAAAAEMSTGVLAMRALQGRGRISMLVTNVTGSYGKKATQKATFRCQDGLKVIETVQRAIDTGESQSVVMQTIGTQVAKDGTIQEVSRFEFTWSFKAKK